MLIITCKAIYVCQDGGCDGMQNMLCFRKNEYNESLDRVWFLRCSELSLEMAH